MPSVPLGRTTRALGAATLGSEALVIVFALPVAANLGDLDPATALRTGIPMVAVCVALAGLLRYRWAYGAASLVQVLVVASGAVVPGMWFIGAVFALLWALALFYGTRADRLSPADTGGTAGPAG